MKAKTLNPDADAGADGAPGTLAAGEIVWAKPKGRRGRWWPARLLAACPAGAAARDVGVSYFGDPGAQTGSTARVRRFADPAADGMAGGSVSRAFLAAVEEARATAVAALRASLTCGCVPPSPSSEAGGVVSGVANLSPAELLAALRDAALDASAVGLVDRARLKSWVGAFGEGWGPGGAGHYPRRELEELVDKIDLDVPAGDGKEDDGWLADAEDEHEASEQPQETPAPQKKRGASALMDELDAWEDENKSDSATGTGTSGKRERKRSKYLSPPYIDLGVSKRPRRATDLSKTFVVYDSKVLPASLDVEEVLSLVLGVARDVSLGSHFQKAAEAFLCSFRGTEFKCPETEFNEGHKSPAVHAIEKADADIAAGAVSDSQTSLKQSKSAGKRRKTNDDGRANSSIKRKKREKYSPAATVGCDLRITPALPIRQIKADDIRSQMKSGCGARVLGVGDKDEKFKPSVSKCEVSPAKSGQEQVTLSNQPAKENNEAKLSDEKKKPSLFKCANPAAVLGAVKSGLEQQDDGFAGKTELVVGNTFLEQSDKKNDEAKFGNEKSEPLVLKYPISDAVPESIKPGQEHVHQSGESVVVTPQVADNTLPNQSAKNNGEAMVGVRKSETNVESILVDVPITSVQTEPTVSEANVRTDESVQSVVTYLHVANVSREATESRASICVDETVQSVGANMPVQIIGADDVPVQNIVPDVQMQSFGADVGVSSEPSTNGDTAEAVDENREHSSVEMHTVQQSYASLQAMVPEMLNKVTNVNATDVIPVNDALKDAHQKDGQPNQEVKLAVGSMANNLSDQAAKGTGSDATNCTPKNKKKKNPTQLFVDPAEIIVEFTPGVIMPSREELLSVFCKFGFVIESQTYIEEVTRSARVVFGLKAEAENAFKRAEFLGEFGPPFATLKLGDLPPLELTAPSPPHSLTTSSRPPLTDIRKNLEKMILARHSSLKNATSDKLLADMQGLLAQVDKMLSGSSTSTPP